MTGVGTPLTTAGVNGAITNLSTAMRNLMWQVDNLSKNVNGQGGGEAALVAAGFTSGDATTALAAISYLNTVAAVYYGTAAQTPAFNFDQELSQWWGGQ
jgi:hypothetical protein